METYKVHHEYHNSSSAFLKEGPSADIWIGRRTGSSKDKIEAIYWEDYEELK
jgi:hypothetical protein